MKQPTNAPLLVQFSFCFNNDKLESEISRYDAGEGIIMDIRNEKKEIRMKMANIRSRISEADRLEQSLVASRLAEQEVLGPLRKLRGGRLNVFSYLSFRDEPVTNYLLNQCLQQGDRILAPRVISKDAMTLHEIHGEGDLASGTWGILEPNESTAIWPVSRYSEIDLVIVPGLAFDLNGGRIGFGAGYYDRFVKQLTDVCGNQGHTVMASLAFKESIVPVIPMEEHDFRLDMLFTVSGTLYMKESSETWLWTGLQNKKE
ncbi:5-formyltetrahydrofolate cyclo-ligase family protein [compost metagenome]